MVLLYLGPVSLAIADYVFLLSVFPTVAYLSVTTYIWTCMKQASVLRIHDGGGQNFSQRCSRLAESSLPGSAGLSRLARTATDDVCTCGTVFGGVRLFAVSVWVLLFLF